MDLSGVHESLYNNGQTVTPHQATQLQPLSSNNFLHDLDKCTKEVITAILTAQKTEAGDEITIPGSSKLLSVGRKVSLAELSRCRRQFVSYCRSRPQEGASVTTSFLTYINTTLK